MAHPKFAASLLDSAFVLLGIAAFSWKASAGTPPPRHLEGTPVVVELFSSEGCSSCPSADAFLRELDRTQPAGSAAVIALEFHVDYWDALGWKDPYARHEFTARQETYARALHDRGIYTPEIIVQGRFALENRDARSSRQRFEAEAARPLGRVRVTLQGSSVRVHVEGAPSPDPGEDHEIWLAVSERGLRSEVLAGENRGRDLNHGPIVRRLLKLGRVRSGTFDGQVEVERDPSWNAGNLRFVAFVQAAQSRRILGAGTS